MRVFLNPARRHFCLASSRAPSMSSLLRRSVVISPSSVFPGLSTASAALCEACDRSGTPYELVENALDQVREARGVLPTFEVTGVRVFTPPLPENGTNSNLMLLFRGTPEVHIEGQLSVSDKILKEPLHSVRRLFFTSSLRVALPYGRMDSLGRDYRILLCRVERQRGGQLLNRAFASEEDLKLLESVEGNMRRFKDGTYDGQVDWLDDGATYCFDANDVRMHTLMCIDTRC